MRDKPKVLLVSDFFYPHWTGISKAVFNMVNELADDFEFTVLTVKYDLALPSSEKIKKTTILREDYLFSLSRAKYSINLVLKAMKEISKHDIILINSPNTNILPISVLAKSFGKKLCIFHQGDLILPEGIGNRLIESIFDLCSHISLTLADKVGSYTKDYAMQSRVLNPYLHKFTAAIMPVVLAKPQTKITNPLLLKLQKEKAAGKVVLGFAGRFVMEKGFDVLFKAIPQIKTKKPYVFAFAGETNIGYEKTFDSVKDLMKPIEKNLLFMGLLNDAELATFYKLIDYIVFPSRSDCFGLVQAEACLSGAPCICADIPGARVLVKTTGYGVLFKKEDDNQLAKALTTIINSRPTFKESFKNVERMLNIKNNAEAIGNYLKQ